MDYRNLIETGKKRVALPLALTGYILTTGCASTGGIDYTQKRTQEDIPEVVQQSQLNYSTVMSAFEQSMINETYNKDSLEGVLEEYERQDDNALFLRIGSDAAKALILYNSLKGSSSGGSSGGGDSGGSIGSGSSDMSGGSSINP